MEEVIKIGDGIIPQLEQFSNTYSFPKSKEEFIKVLVDSLTPTKEELELREKRQKKQSENFKYFSQFKKEVVDMLTPEEQVNFYIAMNTCVNGPAMLGSKQIEVVEKVHKLSEKLGVSEDWVKDSAYAAMLEGELKRLEII